MLNDQNLNRIRITSVHVTCLILTEVINSFCLVSHSMSGHIGDLSPQQEEALSSFREAVTDVDNKPDDSDHYYLRWLRARKFDVTKAELMFRNVSHLLSVLYPPPKQLLELK